MNKIFLILFMCLCLCGCKDNNKVSDESMINEKIEQLMLENEYVIIDVRTKEEYNEGHLVDAINIPYDEIDEDTDLDKDKIVFVYCRSGNRSSIAYKTLNKLGYEVYDLGGYDSINLPKE